MARSALVFIGTALLVIACASAKPDVYLESNLNVLTVGAPKDAVLRHFGFTNSDGRAVYGLRMRTARQSSNGRVIEVGEMPLLTQDNQVIQYWFIFEDGRLAQWGRPREWQSAAARYQIEFNPSPVPR